MKLYISGQNIYYTSTLDNINNSGDLYCYLLDIDTFTPVLTGDLIYFADNTQLPGYKDVIFKFITSGLSPNVYLCKLYNSGNNTIIYNLINYVKVSKEDFTSGDRDLLQKLYNLEYNRLTYIRQMDWSGLITNITSLNCWHNDTVKFTFIISDSEGAPVDLTEYDVYLSSKLFRYDPNISGNNLKLNIIEPTSGLVSGQLFAGREGKWLAQITLINKNTLQRKVISEFYIWVKEDLYSTEPEEVPPYE